MVAAKPTCIPVSQPSVSFGTQRNGSGGFLFWFPFPKHVFDVASWRLCKCRAARVAADWAPSENRVGGRNGLRPVNLVGHLFWGKLGEPSQAGLPPSSAKI